MLKITVHQTPQGITFQLEGRLAGPWVEELGQCWTSAGANSPPDRPRARIDLSGVTYVDPAGKRLLERLHREGATLLASGCLMNCLVNDITNAAHVPANSDRNEGIEAP